MFTQNKTVICIEFTKSSVFCALANISGKKVDIISIDSIKIESGVLEEGIIYDVSHLQQVVKNLVTTVSKGQSKIDAAWVSIPDNKILITKYDVAKEGKDLDQGLLHKAIEEQFNYSASRLYLINRQIQELNNRVFFLSNAIRVDNLEPYLEVFDVLNIPVEGIFPTFQCIFEELKTKFSTPTLLLYPFERGFKFFLADSNGVHLESVWGHNVIEFNENFDKAIEEIVQYARQSKDVALNVKNIVVIESSTFNSEVIQEYLNKTGINYSWVQGSEGDGDADSVAIIVLKGLIKSSMANSFAKGFLEPQPILEYDQNSPAHEHMVSKNIEMAHDNERGRGYITPFSDRTVVKDIDALEKRWNFKVIIATFLFCALIIGGFAWAGITLSKIINKDNGNTGETEGQNVANKIPTPISSPGPTMTPEASPTPTLTPTPDIIPVAKDQVQVLVLNGNDVAGEAGRISGILRNSGFITKTPGNNPTRGVETTTITYRDPGAKALAEEIKTLIEPSYASANIVEDVNSTEDILVVLGTR